MRVGFDARWYNKSGVGTYVAGLLPAIVRAGCELVVYVDPNNPVPGLGNLQVQTVPISCGRYSPFASFEFRRRAKLDQLDVFHSPFYIAPRLECPVIVTVHDPIPFLFPIYPWLKQSMVKAGYRTASRRAAHIIADSQQTSRDIQRILGVSPGRITAVHLAAARETFHPCASAGELESLQKKWGACPPYIVVASARNWRTKNLESAFQALDMARSHAGVEFRTLVYGPPEGLEALRTDEVWRRLNLRRAGYVEVADMASLFRHAHAFVMPSLYEGFGLPLVEAMSCGCPVIASDRGALPEVGGAGAQCFDPFDIQGMAAAIVALLRSPCELERRRADALQRAADFSWDKAAFETISVYHHVNRQFSTPQAN
jgi:glycosyltransferase involved in cell wall biosynthesis